MITVPEDGYKAHFGEDAFVFSRTLLGLDDTWKSLNLPKTHMYQPFIGTVTRPIKSF